MGEFTEFKIKDTDYDDQQITVNEVEIDDKDLIIYVQETLSPDDVFDQKDLHAWAENEGYIKEEK